MDVRKGTWKVASVFQDLRFRAYISYRPRQTIRYSQLRQYFNPIGGGSLLILRGGLDHKS